MQLLSINYSFIIFTDVSMDICSDVEITQELSQSVDIVRKVVNRALDTKVIKSETLKMLMDTILNHLNDEEEIDNIEKVGRQILWNMSEDRTKHKNLLLFITSLIEEMAHKILQDEQNVDLRSIQSAIVAELFAHILRTNLPSTEQQIDTLYGTIIQTVAHDPYMLSQEMSGSELMKPDELLSNFLAKFIARNGYDFGHAIDYLSQNMHSGWTHTLIARVLKKKEAQMLNIVILNSVMLRYPFGLSRSQYQYFKKFNEVWMPDDSVPAFSLIHNHGTTKRVYETVCEPLDLQVVSDDAQRFVGCRRELGNYLTSTFNNKHLRKEIKLKKDSSHNLYLTLVASGDGAQMTKGKDGINAIMVAITAIFLS